MNACFCGFCKINCYPQKWRVHHPCQLTSYPTINVMPHCPSYVTDVNGGVTEEGAPIVGNLITSEEKPPVYKKSTTCNTPHKGACRWHQ